MGFHSMDIIQGEDFEADFYIREDDGIFIKDLSNASSSYLTIFNKVDRTSIYKANLTINTEEVGRHFVRLNFAGNLSNLYLDPTIDGKDDQYLNRSGYYAVFVVKFTNEYPVTAFIDKFNVLG